VADSDVKTSTELGNTADISSVDLVRFTKDIVAQYNAQNNPADNVIATENNPDITRLAWTIKDHLQTSGTDNQAAALETLQTGVEAIIKENYSGPADDRLDRVEQFLNLVNQGITGRFNTADAQTIQKKKAAAELAAARARDTRTTVNIAIEASSVAIDAAAAAGVSAEQYKAFSYLINNNLSPEGRAAEGRIARGSHPDQIEKDTQLYLEELHDILSQHPDYTEGMTPDKQQELLKVIAAERLAATELGLDPTNLKDLTPEQKAAFDKEFNYFLKDEGSILNRLPAEKWPAIINAENFGYMGSQIADLGETLGARAAASLAHGISGLNNAENKQESLDKFVENIQNTIGENGQHGLALAENIEKLSAQLENLSQYANDKIIRDQISHYESRIAELDTQFNEITNMNVFLSDTIDFVDQNNDLILNSENPQEVIALALENDELMSAYRLAVQGMDPNARERVFMEMSANLGLDEAQAMEAYNNTLGFETQIFELSDLRHAKYTLENEIADGADATDEDKIMQLTAQISAREAGLMQLISSTKETVAEADAEISQSKDRINELGAQEAIADPDGIGHDPLMMGNNRMGLVSAIPTIEDKINAEYDEWQAAEAEKEAAEAVVEQIEDALDINGPDVAQQFVTDNKAQIEAMLKEIPAHSPEQLANLIKNMGDSQQTDISTTEAMAIVQTIANTPELAELSPTLSDETPSALTAKGNMTPTDITAEAAKPAANEETYDLAANGTQPLPGNQM